MTRQLLVFGAIAAGALGCSGGGHSSGGTAGAPADGGGPGTGGHSTGGVPGSGGLGSGGQPGSGGHAATGGAPGTGGISAGTGGLSGTGGVPGTGGSPGTGGAGGGGPGGGTNGAGGSGASAGRGGGAVGGAGGHGGGAGATAGNGGPGGHAGGPGGTTGGGGNAMPSLTITSTTSLPAAQIAILGVRVAVDSQDTAVVLGPSASSLTADPGPALTWIPRSGSSTQKTFPNDITPAAMALDGADAIWLAGQLYNPVSFGGTTIQPVDAGYYLVKLAPDGTNTFTKAVARTDAHLSAATTYAIAFDGQGNAYVVGSLLISDTATTSAVFVTKFSSAGALLMDRTFAGSDTQASAFDAAIAPSGDLVIAGSFSGSLQVGSAKLTSLAGTSTNGFVAVLNTADLTAKSAFAFGGANGFDLAYAVDVTSGGTLRIAGALSGMSSLGGTGVQADANGSGFVADVSAAAATNWVDLIGAQGIVFQTSTNGADRTFAAGRIDGTTHDSFLAAVGPGTTTVTLPLRVSTGLDANGAVAVAADRHGGVWVGGEIEGRVDFGSGPIGSTDPMTLSNFVVHLEP